MSEEVELTVLLIGLVGAIGLQALRFTTASSPYDGELPEVLPVRCTRAPN